MSAAAFEAYTTGTTITFSDRSGAYGGEQYRDGRRVSWSYLDGDCLDGTWFSKGDQICFDYGTGFDVQCWQFFKGAHGLWARYANDDSGFLLFEVESSNDPLYCKGPDVGS